MESTYQPRGNNLVLASLSAKTARIFNSASRKNFQLEKEELGYIQKFRDYLALARKGEKIKRQWDAGQGILISRETERALKRHDELSYRLGGWDSKNISRIGHALKNAKTFGKRNDIEDRTTYTFFSNLAQESLKNLIYQSCKAS